MKTPSCCTIAVVVHLCFTASPLAAAPAADLGNAKLAKWGFLDVTAAPFRADPTGKADSTRALQEAIVYAREHQLVTFFPPGTYLVSDTLECVQTRHDPVTHEVLRSRKGRDWPCVLVGSRRGPKRPAIVLAPDSPGFGDPEHRKYVIHFWARAVDEGTYDDPQPNISMNQMLVGIDVGIGRGNPGAVAVRHRAAQGSGVEDSTIDARGGYIGLEGGAGSGGSHANVTVIGGRIGVDLRETQPAPTITGFTLIGQTETALISSSRQALTAVGLRIETETAGPVIVTRQPQGPNHGQLCLVDSSIVFRKPGDNTAIDAAASLYLNNVYLQDARTVVRGPDGLALATDHSGWTRVGEYALGIRPPLSWKGQGATRFQFETPIFIDGVRLASASWGLSQSSRNGGLSQFSRNENGTVPFRTAGAASPASLPPADLQSRHLWDEQFPGWESPEAVNVKKAPYNAAGDGQADDTAAIQRAIDESRTVFLPKGTYRVSKTIRLRPETRLIGAHRCFTWLEAASAPGGDFRENDPSHPEPVVQTADDAGAATVVAQFGIRVLRNSPAAYCLDWRSGRNSIFRNVNTVLPFWWPAGREPEWRDNQPLVVIEAGGGGRWYNFHQESYMGHGPDYRHLLVEGTTEPLSIYQCNPEHARSDANMELRGARHVSVYGVKGEYNRPILAIRDCDDVRIFGYGGNAAALEGTALFVVERTPNFLLANLVDSPRTAGGSASHFAGIGVDPRKWHMVQDRTTDGKTILTPPLDRPVLYRRGHPGGEEAAK
jgi:hypothetical protein